MKILPIIRNDIYLFFELKFELPYVMLKLLKQEPN